MNMGHHRVPSPASLKGRVREKIIRNKISRTYYQQLSVL